MMKSVTLCLFCFISFAAFAQYKPLVVVVPFDVQGKAVTQEEAKVVTELFTTELVNTGKVDVVSRTSFDKIAQEMKFQTSEWASSERAASLGRALNAQGIISGQFAKLGSAVVWTAHMIDVNTAQILYSSRARVANIDEIWDKLPEFINQMVSRLSPNLPSNALPSSQNTDPSNPLLGRWQATTKLTAAECGGYPREISAILNIRGDGSVVIERYDVVACFKSRAPAEQSLQGTGTHSMETPSYGHISLDLNGQFGRFPSVVSAEITNISAAQFRASGFLCYESTASINLLTGYEIFKKIGY